MLPARRNQRVSGSCSFWNARGPLEDHAVHVPADAGAVRRGLLRHLASPPPGFGHVPQPLAVAGHDAAPATPTSTCPYRGRAGRRGHSRSRPCACSWGAGAVAVTAPAHRCTEGNAKARPPLLPVTCEAAVLPAGTPSQRGSHAGTPDYRICYSSGVGDWDIDLTTEVAAWLEELQASDAKTADLVDDAVYALSRSGPALGRPLVDTITGSTIKDLKELRPGSSGTSEVRILFVFDPWRSAILRSPGTSLGSGTGGMPRRSRVPSSSMRSI